MSKRALGPQEVDTATPQAYPHLSQNLKGAQIAKEKEAEIQRLNEESQVTIHTIALGFTSAFLENLAAQNRGSYIVAGR